MIARSLTLGIVGAAALAAPHAAPAQTTGYSQRPSYYGQESTAPAQPYYSQPQNPGSYPSYAPRYGETQGGYYSREEGPTVSFAGYPQFRGFEDQIRQEIQSGVSQDMIEPDDANSLMAQLRDIRRREVREYQEHGWNLPPDVVHDIRTDLADLDRDVQQARTRG